MYRTIDLFAGLGGIRRGFEMTGEFENALSAEFEKYACITYEHLFGEDPFNDVTKEEFKKKVEATPYDVLLAGFPCQAFSIAGKKEGFLDKTRGTLFFDVADILNRTRPRAFLLENVQGLLSHKKGATFRTILETLVMGLDYKVVGCEYNSMIGDIEYKVADFKGNSRDFGIPQNRPRVYIMGFDRKLYGDKVDTLPINRVPDKSDEPPIYRDLNELLEFKADPQFYVPSKYLETLKRHKERHQGRGNGFGYMVVNAPGIKNPVSNAILATGGSGRERNLVYDPQPGIGGMIVPGKQSPLNDEGIRFMTPREWGKLQGFINYAFIENGVDRFKFPERMPINQQYKQFGNSVTIPAIKQMAKAMIKCLRYLENEC